MRCLLGLQFDILHSLRLHCGSLRFGSWYFSYVGVCVCVCYMER